MRFVGIDPGNSAGFALITESGSLVAISCKDNIKEAYKILSDLSKLPPGSVEIGIEDVHAIWGTSAKSTFVFGSNLGKWQGIIDYLGMTYQPVPAKVWQATMTNPPVKPKPKACLPAEKRRLNKQHKDLLKMESFRAATAAFPDTRLPSHDVADSINICRYVKYRYEQQNSLGRKERL